MNSKTYIYIFCSLLLFGACSDGSKFNITSKLNPHGIAPLSGVATISTKEKCDVYITLLGDTTVQHTFNAVKGRQEIPILGLMPDMKNEVEIQLQYPDEIIIDTLVFETDALPVFFPDIKIDTLNRNAMEEGWHLCDIHYAQGGKFHSLPMIFDDKGQVRWYLDLSFHDAILWPIRRLKDGVMAVGGKNKFYEFDMTGKTLKDVSIHKKYWIHHEILELPNGQLLMAVGKNGSTITLEDTVVRSGNDFMVLYDRKKEKVVKEWDLAEVLDVRRGELIHIGGEGNWLHLNGIDYDEKDNSIILSSKHQGLIKISWENELKWIIAPDKNWGKSGRKADGFETSDYLMTAVDSAGIPYPEEVQVGNASADDFDFPWGNHAPLLLDNGNLMFFDNGYFRNWDKKGRTYSMAVEYSIDETAKTVSQIWQYGKERGVPFQSIIICDVDKLSNSNVLVTSGYLEPKTNSGKIVEVKYPSKEVVFEATLYYKTMNGSGVFGWGEEDVLYRSERIKLYE